MTDNDEYTALWIVRNLGGLIASLPSLLASLQFLWIHDQLGNRLMPLFLLPLNLVPLLVAEISYVLDLGVLGLVGSLILSVVYSRLRVMGQRLL